VTIQPETETTKQSSETGKSDELQTFLFLTIFLAPIIAVAGVGGFGFLVWMSQIILGPPTG
tara:strand:+ start:24246 stop:24428 length:183 start_codon:yes stop_codon:yes gene_type:complete